MGTLASCCVNVQSQVSVETARGRHDEAARMSAGNLELLARDQVAWVSHTACTASPTTAVTIQTGFNMEMYV